MAERPPLRLCLFGAAPDTSNLGVSALCWSVVDGLLHHAPDAEITVFDYGRGLRSSAYQCNGATYHIRRCGAANTRRLWRAESFWQICWAARLGLPNAAARTIRAADAVLDISGGDSFTDLYGPRRFQSVTLPKMLALKLGKPLMLLPQTYGPYRDPAVRQTAADIVRRAAQCWARDERSFAVLKDLLGDAFDPRRHRCGVDVAFALAPRQPVAPLPAPLAAWLNGQDAQSLNPSIPQSQNRPTAIGLNVSGLIYNDPVAMRQRYGFRADYREVVHGFLRRVLAETDARALLIPHVLTSPGHYESDAGANEAVLAALRADNDARVAVAATRRLAVVPPIYDHPAEMKWIISRCDWFCGMRMHACIAGLSSRVPSAAIAYSPKTQGVFETCGVGDAVVDPRELDTADVVERLLALLEQRDAVRSRLAAKVPSVCARAAAPLAAVAGLAAASSSASRLVVTA